MTKNKQKKLSLLIKIIKKYILSVGMGKDHTIFALVAGRVRLERSSKNLKRNFVHAVPDDHVVPEV